MGNTENTNNENYLNINGNSQRKKSEELSNSINSNDFKFSAFEEEAEENKNTKKSLNKNLEGKITNENLERRLTNEINQLMEGSIISLEKDNMKDSLLSDFYITIENKDLEDKKFKDFFVEEIITEENLNTNGDYTPINTEIEENKKKSKIFTNEIKDFSNALAKCLHSGYVFIFK